MHFLTVASALALASVVAGDSVVLTYQGKASDVETGTFPAATAAVDIPVADYDRGFGFATLDDVDNTGSMIVLDKTGISVMPTGGPMKGQTVTKPEAQAPTFKSPLFLGLSKTQAASASLAAKEFEAEMPMLDALDQILDESKTGAILFSLEQATVRKFAWRTMDSPPTEGHAPEGTSNHGSTATQVTMIGVAVRFVAVEDDSLKTLLTSVMYDAPYDNVLRAGDVTVFGIGGATAIGAILVDGIAFHDGATTVHWVDIDSLEPVPGTSPSPTPDPSGHCPKPKTTVLDAPLPTWVWGGLVVGGLSILFNLFAAYQLLVRSGGGAQRARQMRKVDNQVLKEGLLTADDDDDDDDDSRYLNQGAKASPAGSINNTVSASEDVSESTPSSRGTGRRKRRKHRGDGESRRKRDENV